MTPRILSKQTRKSKPVKNTKPEKPYDGFPLTAHATGKWCKKVRGKIHYFGSWDDPIAALNEWLEVKDALIAGADPKRREDQCDIGWLVNSFLDSKDQQRKEGDLSSDALSDYLKACKRIADFFGKGRSLDTIDAPDFKRLRGSFPETWGPTTINNTITRISVIFNFAYEVGAVDKPVRTGPNFKRVSKKKQRLHRAAQPSKVFSAEEIHRLIDKADVQLKAMILLGINAGYGNADCGRLEVQMIDFKRCWLEGLREKTAIQRAAWLWPETIEALEAAIENRYDNAPASLANRVFITKRRQAWFREKSVTMTDDGKPKVSGHACPLSLAFRRLTVKADCRRSGVGFYSLRHVFETVAGNSKDQIAVNYVMGHCDDSMAAVYREGIDPQRIIDVCSYVRDWWLAGIVKGRTK